MIKAFKTLISIPTFNIYLRLARHHSNKMKERGDKHELKYRIYELRLTTLMGWADR